MNNKTVQQICVDCSIVYFVPDTIWQKVLFIICPCCGHWNKKQSRVFKHGSQTLHEAKLYILPGGEQVDINHSVLVTKTIKPKPTKQRRKIVVDEKIKKDRKPDEKIKKDRKPIDFNIGEAMNTWIEEKMEQDRVDMDEAKEQFFVFIKNNKKDIEQEKIKSFQAIEADKKVRQEYTAQAKKELEATKENARKTIESLMTGLQKNVSECIKTLGLLEQDLTEHKTTAHERMEVFAKQMKGINKRLAAHVEWFSTVKI